MRRAANVILLLEPLFLAIIVAALWFSDPANGNFLLLVIPPLLARLILYRRLWVTTPLNLFFFLFILVCAVDTYIALMNPAVPPYSWGWYMPAKPAMGIALALSITSRAYERRSVSGSVLVVLLLAVLVGALGVVAAQYVLKSNQLTFIIEQLPRLQNFPGAQGGFNVNEIGGAMTFLTPFALGLGFYSWRVQRAWFQRIAATLAGILLLLALFLGQSRLSLVGTTVAVGALIFLLIPAGRWRYLALAALALYSAAEIAVIRQAVDSTSVSTTSTYAIAAEQSLVGRSEIFSGAITLIRENPLTGYGLNEFRRREVRARLVPDFNMIIVPHAHNELLQVGVDAGLPGMALYIGWHLALAWMIWRTWRQSDGWLRAVSLAAAAGLAGHAIFGLGDAITMYDRFAFVYWLLVGLVGATYVLTVKPADQAAPAS